MTGSLHALRCHRPLRPRRRRCGDTAIASNPLNGAAPVSGRGQVGVVQPRSVLVAEAAGAGRGAEGQGRIAVGDQAVLVVVRKCPDGSRPRARRSGSASPAAPVQSSGAQARVRRLRPARAGVEREVDARHADARGEGASPRRARRCRAPCRCCRWSPRPGRWDAPGPRRRPVRSACSGRTAPMGCRPRRGHHHRLRRCRHGGCPDTSIKVAKAAGMTDRFTLLLLVRLRQSAGTPGQVHSLRAHREGTLVKARSEPRRHVPPGDDDG